MAANVPNVATPEKGLRKAMTLVRRWKVGQDQWVTHR
jgi:hypothetical protein